MHMAAKQRNFCLKQSQVGIKIQFSPFNSPRWTSVVVVVVYFLFIVIIVVDAGNSNFVSRRVPLEQSPERSFHHHRTKSSLPLLPLAACLLVSALIAFNVNQLSLSALSTRL